jgi:hypothetical protein
MLITRRDIGTFDGRKGRQHSESSFPHGLGERFWEAGEPNLEGEQPEPVAEG